MKRVLTLACMTALFMCVTASPTLAVEARESENQVSSYPVSVEEYMSGDTLRIKKVYILSKTEDPASIPTDDFTREGLTYVLLDMTREDQTETESKVYTESVSMDSKTKDMEQILKDLAAELVVTTEDGYSGTLHLDAGSIRVDVKGYGTSKRTVTATRAYPSLSDADVSLIPKTIEDSGRTLELEDLEWEETGELYTANAVYSGTATGKYATGYMVTADYTGEVARTISDKVIYTAVFGGVPKEGTSFDWNRVGWLAIPLAAALVLLAVRFTKKSNKRRTTQ